MKRSAGGLALVLICAAIAGASALRSPGRVPAPGRETTLWLAVESRAVDGDLSDSRDDRARFRARFGTEPREILLEAGSSDARERVYDAPWLWTSLAALARRLAGGAGPFLLQGLLFATAVLAAAATLRVRLGPTGAPLLAGTTLAGSAALAAALRLEPHALELAAASLAAVAVWRRGHGRAAPAADVYAGETGGTPGLARWLGAGVAMGVVLAGSVAYLPLLVPLFAAVPERRRKSARLLLAAGAVVALAAIVVLGGAPWPPLDFELSPRLGLWSAIGLLVGRGVGLLPYYLPVALLAPSAGRDEGRRWALPALLLAALLQLALSPFDFVEASGVGNAWWLAPIAILLGAASHAESRSWTLFVALAGAPFVLAPAVLAPLGLERASTAVERFVAPLADRLPEATTLREAPRTYDLRRPGLLARGIEPGVVGTPTGPRIAERRARIVLVSESALSSVRLELGREAPVAIGVRGGKAGNTTIRPSGEIALDVLLDPGAARRHPVWWSRSGAFVHRLELELPGRPPRPIPLDVAFGRAAAPGAAPTVEAGGR